MVQRNFQLSYSDLSRATKVLLGLPFDITSDILFPPQCKDIHASCIKQILSELTSPAPALSLKKAASPYRSSFMAL